MAKRPTAPAEPAAPGPERGTRASRLVRPLKRGAARARELLARLLRSARARGRPRAGSLQAFHDALERIEKSAEAAGLGPAFLHLRARLEALLAILLEVEDDRLAGQAASGLEAELAPEIARAEMLFARPEALFELLDLRRADLAAVRAARDAHDLPRAAGALVERMRSKTVPEGLSRWLSRPRERLLDEARLVSRGFLLLRPTPHGPDGTSRGGVWTFVGRSVPWEALPFPSPHEHAEIALLARASAQAGDEALASDAVSRLVEWAARVPPPPAVRRAGGLKDLAVPFSGVAWEASCLAGRLLSWGACFLALRRSAVFTPAVGELLLRLVHESASLLAERMAAGGRMSDRSEARRVPVPGAVGPEGAVASGVVPGPSRVPIGPDERESCEAYPGLLRARAGAALAVSGVLFDELAGSESWSVEGARLLAEVAATDLDADGGVLGPAPDRSADGAKGAAALEIHESFLDALVTGALALARAFQAESQQGSTFGPKVRDVERAAVAALEFERAVLLPGGELPCLFGEDPGDGAERTKRLALAAELLGSPRTPATGEAGFRTFTESGFYVMRSGADDCLVVRAKGSREAVAASGGAPALVVRLSGREVSWGEQPRCEVSRAGPPCDYVRWVSELPGGAIHRREVVHVERRYWVLADRVCSDAPVEWALELDVAPESFSVSADGRRLVAGTLLAVLAGPTDSGFRPAGPGARAASVALSGTDVRAILVLYPLRGEAEGTLRVEPVLVPASEAEGRQWTAAFGCPGRAVGAHVRRAGFEDIVAFPGGAEGQTRWRFGQSDLEEARLVAGATRSQAIVLSRPEGEGERPDSPWRTLLEIGDGT